MTNSRRIFLLQAAIAVLLLFAVAVQASRVIERHVNARWQLVGSSQGGLKSSTRTWLASLSGHVSLTYFVSARSGMPSSMKGVEDEVTRLLDALRRAAPGAIDCRIVDPTLPQDSRFEPSREAPAGGARRSEPPPPPGTEYASSSRGASPVKARTVLADESNEVAVWSSLVLSHDQFTDGLIQDITAADLPYLEDLIVETLRAGAAVVQPVIAVAAPQEGYSTVRKLCASLTGARTIEANLETATALPLEADLLVWVDPHRLRPEQALALERYIATGRSVILAGSAYSIDYLPREGGKIAYRIAPSSADWASFLRPLGLTLAPAVFTDKYHDAITWRRNGGLFKVDAPFHVRVLPSLFDTRSFLGPNAGALLVSAISAIQWDARAVAAWGRRVEVVATTSENTRRTDLPAGEFDDAALAGGAAVPKQPWIVLLKPQDPWQGELLVAGSPLLFHDDPYAQGGNANQVFLRTLLRTYTAPTRLARIRVPKRLPQRLPELSLGARVGWRAFVVAAVPMGLLGAALRRARTRPLGPRKVPWVSRAALGGACLAVVLLVSRLLAGFWLPRADLTEDDINTPSALTLRLLDAVRDGLEVDLIASESFRLPPEMKPVEPRILGALRTLGLRPRVVRPEDLAASERDKLRAEGLQPFDVQFVVNDAAASSEAWCALRLRRSGRSEIVPQLDARTIEHLEFLLCAAARRLDATRGPVVGVLSDLPRLTPAEAHEDYQQKGYTAPVGSDVYSRAKRLLELYGYHVAYINPEAPVYPNAMDVLVWLQPRFPQRSWGQFTKFLAEGGKAFVAVQHYNVLQRQFRGAGFTTVYWPQPQFHSFNEYLKLIGVQQIGDKQGEQPGEVLFDRQHADLVLETQVNRTAFREHDPQQVSRPFLIRAAGAGLSQRSVVTSRLGGLLFAWGSRFVLDDARLGTLGISVQDLVTTSRQVWTYAWSGGWIPEQSFEPPDDPARFLPSPQKLAILLEGRFPHAELQKDEASGRETLRLVKPGADAQQPPGKLLLVGCSEMFKNAYLEDAEYQHDQFLLNSVALLAYGDDLAEIQARRRTPKAIPYEPAGVKLRWRTLVVAAPPLAFVLFGLLCRFVRRRPIVRGARS